MTGFESSQHYRVSIEIVLTFLMRKQTTPTRILHSRTPSCQYTVIELGSFLMKAMHSFWFCVCLCSVVSYPLWPCGLQPTRILCPWNFPCKNTRVGCHFLLQILSIWGSNLSLLHLLHWQVDFVSLCHLGILAFYYVHWKCFLPP